MGLPRTLAAMAGHRSGLTDTPWRFPGKQPWVIASLALLKKPRECGLGSCDLAWRGHFFRNLHFDRLGARATSAVKSRGPVRPSVQARHQSMRVRLGVRLDAWGDHVVSSLTSSTTKCVPVPRHQLPDRSSAEGGPERRGRAQSRTELPPRP